LTHVILLVDGSATTAQTPRRLTLLRVTAAHTRPPARSSPICPRTLTLDLLKKRSLLRGIYNAFV
jgi:hypothetical protein